MFPISATEASGSFASGLPVTWMCTSPLADPFEASINGGVNAALGLVSISFFTKGDPAHGAPPSFTATFDKGTWDKAQKKFGAIGAHTPFDKVLMEVPCNGKFNSDVGPGTTAMTLLVRLKKAEFSRFFLDLEFKVNAGPNSSLNRTYHLTAVPQKEFVHTVTGKPVEEWIEIHRALDVHKGVGVHAEVEVEPEPEHVHAHEHEHEHEHEHAPDAGAGSGAGGGAGAAADALAHDEDGGVVMARPVM